ncbi:MAG: FxsA family protein [Candidatus Acetothermia bacterium]
MSAKLIILFTALPLLEIVFLVRIGAAIGVWWTALIVAGTGVVGALLARREGINVLGRMRERFQEGELPTAELIDGAILLISGAFLLTPGVLTDFIGLAGLVPFSRRGIRLYSQKWVKREWDLKRQSYINVDDEDVGEP